MNMEMKVDKGGFEHYMLKEIHEQPRVIEETLSKKLVDGVLNFGDESFTAEEIKNFNKIYISACGTAYHAGLSAKYAFEKFTGIHCEVEVASEFRYSEPPIDEHTLAIFISQSGETADTLLALRYAKERGASIISLSNVLGSTIASESDKVIYTWAGPEMSVASTKAYTTQVLTLYLLAMDFGLKLGKLDNAHYTELIDELKTIPEKIEAQLKDLSQYAEYAKLTTSRPSLYFLGRYLDFNTAKEGALKLKETSYIHAEALPSGEFKHGPIALIEEGTPMVVIATQTNLVDRMISSMRDAKERGARIIAITQAGTEGVAEYAEHVVEIPNTFNILTPLLAVVPLQLLAYYSSVAMGNDVDQPRNLSKAVTEE